MPNWVTTEYILFGDVDTLNEGRETILSVPQRDDSEYGHY